MNMTDVTTLALAQLNPVPRLVIVDGVLYRGVKPLGPIESHTPSTETRCHAGTVLRAALPGDIVQLTGQIFAQSRGPLSAPRYWQTV